MFKLIASQHKSMDVYNGCTSWIEDDCPDTFSEFIFLFPSCSCSVWLTLTVLKHKMLRQILFKNSWIGLVNGVHLCTPGSMYYVPLKLEIPVFIHEGKERTLRHLLTMLILPIPCMLFTFSKECKDGVLI